MVQVGDGCSGGLLVGPLRDEGAGVRRCSYPGRGGLLVSPSHDYGAVTS